MKKQTQALKIYRNGQLSYSETYLPVVKQKLVDFGNQIDHYFVTHEWATKD